MFSVANTLAHYQRLKPKHLYDLLDSVVVPFNAVSFGLITGVHIW